MAGIVSSSHCSFTLYHNLGYGEMCLQNNKADLDATTKRENATDYTKKRSNT